MMVDRRSSCNTKRPFCMTAGFMFGIIIGLLLNTNGSWLQGSLTVLVASSVFHLTYVRNFNFSQLVSKVIKKGS
jgi:hypothetical protein